MNNRKYTQIMINTVYINPEVRKTQEMSGFLCNRINEWPDTHT